MVAVRQLPFAERVTGGSGQFPDSGRSGDNDQFLADQLQPAKLAELARQRNWPLQLRVQPGYDHSYFTIASFVEDHLRFHAENLR